MNSNQHNHSLCSMPLEEPADRHNTFDWYSFVCYRSKWLYAMTFKGFKNKEKLLTFRFDR